MILERFRQAGKSKQENGDSSNINTEKSELVK